MGSAVPGDFIGQRADRLAACIFAVAVGWALLLLIEGRGSELRWTIAISGALAGGIAASTLLSRLAGQQLFPLSAFEPVEFEFEDWIEDAPGAVDAGNANPDTGEEEDELLLEDALTLVSDQSQVIRLFDPAQMPTAGELHERIDRHLATGPRVVPDSTQELYAALSALRQTLR